MSTILAIKKKKKFFKVVFLCLFFIAIFKWIFVIVISNLFSLRIKKYIAQNTSAISNYNIINNTKYILLWTNPTTTPFQYLGMGYSIFVKKNCKWTNCYVTSDVNHLGDITEFEVIAFNGPELNEILINNNIPRRRTYSQKYVYANIESASNYPICSDVWNEFFNWTWTYKLNSDALWGYMVIRNASNHVIGPSVNINWLRLNEMQDVSEDLKTKLATKSEAVAWFVSSCMTSSFREDYVFQLKLELEKFDLKVTVYGNCGESYCPMQLMPRCLKMLEKKYFFYLSFENAISEDYVTEKILHALNHNTVPIVFGGANYTRFMPDGSYLNAYKMKPEQLAIKINQIMKTPKLYYKFFRWKKYYSYHLRHETSETDDYCNFCAMLNDNKLMETTTSYDNFDVWWTGSNIKNICHPTSEIRKINN